MHFKRQTVRIFISFSVCVERNNILSTHYTAWSYNSTIFMQLALVNWFVYHWSELGFLFIIVVHLVFVSRANNLNALPLFVGLRDTLSYSVDMRRILCTSLGEFNFG